MARRSSQVPPKPQHGLEGVRAVWSAKRWKFRAVLTVEGKRVVGPLRDDSGAAHRDYLGLVERRSAPAGAVLTLGEGLASVLAEQKARGRASERSQKATQAICQALLRAWLPDMLLADFSAAELNWYVAAAARHGRTVTSLLEKDLPTLRAALAAGGVRWPADFHAPRKPRRPMAVLAAVDVARILERIRQEPFQDPSGRPLLLTSRAHHADLIELLFLTGLRLGELARLTVADVDLSACALQVLNHKDAGAALQSSRDAVALGEGSRGLLQRLVAAAAPSRGQQRLRGSLGALRLVPGGENYLTTMFARWRDRLAEPRLCGRTLRHSFVSGVLLLTGDLAATRDLARHRSVQTTARYVHSLTQQQRATRAALAGLLGQSPAGGS